MLIKCSYSLVFLAKGREYQEANLRYFWPAHTAIYRGPDEHLSWGDLPSIFW